MPDPDTADTNAAIWKSAQGISCWRLAAGDRERRRGEQRRLMAGLLPFGDEEEFTFVDLGAGIGAAARTVLDRCPGARAILADFSPQMADFSPQMADFSPQMADFSPQMADFSPQMMEGDWILCLLSLS